MPYTCAGGYDLVLEICGIMAPKPPMAITALPPCSTKSAEALRGNRWTSNTFARALRTIAVGNELRRPTG